MTAYASLPQVQPGDSLSGYVQRFASLHGMQTRTEPADALGLMRAGFQGETDSALLDLVLPSAARIQVFQARTGLTHDQIAGMVLQQFDGSWFTLDSYRGKDRPSEFVAHHGRNWRNLHWIRAQGSAYCVQCLQERPLAHQIAWRITLLPVCLRHQQILQWGCGCGAPTPSWWRGTIKPPGLTNCICTCGGDVALAARSSRPAEGSELRAAQAVAAWLNSYASKGDLQSAQALAQTQALAQLILGVAREGRRAEVDYDPRFPKPVDVAPILSLAVNMREEGLSSCPPELLQQMRRAVSRRPENRMVELREDAHLSFAVHASVSDQWRRNWRAYAPVLRRTPGFEVRHLPALFPVHAFTAALSDVLWDGVEHVSKNGWESGRAPGHLALRRVAAVTAAAGLWSVNITKAVRLINASTSVRLPLLRITHALVELERLEEYWNALRLATLEVTNGRRIDYQARRELVLGQGVHIVSELMYFGMGRGEAGAWLVDDYACCERRGLEHLRPQSMQAWPVCPEGLDEFAEGLDARLASSDVA